jgi:prephenate dehydrogenase
VATSKLVELAEAVDASPLFIDPAEYDGLYSGVGNLTGLISLALIRATLGTPGWAEMRKVAGPDFVAMTSPAAIDPKDRLETLLLNQENGLRRLDMFMEELKGLRALLASGDREALEEMLAHASESRAFWINERIEGTWEDMPGAPEITKPGEAISRIFVGEMLRRRPIIDDEEEG